MEDRVPEEIPDATSTDGPPPRTEDDERPWRAELDEIVRPDGAGMVAVYRTLHRYDVAVDVYGRNVIVTSPDGESFDLTDARRRVGTEPIKAKSHLVENMQALCRARMDGQTMPRGWKAAVADLVGDYKRAMESYSRRAWREKQEALAAAAAAEEEERAAQLELMEAEGLTIDMHAMCVTVCKGAGMKEDGTAACVGPAAWLPGELARVRAAGSGSGLARNLDNLFVNNFDTKGCLPVTPDQMIALDGHMPVGFRWPHGYYLQAGGIWKEKTDAKGNTTSTLVTNNLVLPVGVGTDDDGGAVVRMGWRSAGRTRVEYFHRSAFTSAVAWAKAVGNLEISTDAGPFLTFMRATLKVNEHVLARQHVVRVLGWQPDGSWVSSAVETPGRVVRPLFQEQEPFAEAYHPQGTLAGWQAAVAAIETHWTARRILAAAFAAPLLRVLGVQPFTVDAASTSSLGKSTAAEATTSVFADPSKMGTWDDTRYIVEFRLNMAQGILVVLDESQRAIDDPEKIKRICYLDSVGRARAGGAHASSLKLGTIILSTGESPLTTIVKDQGAAARVVTESDRVFNLGWGAIESDALKAAVRANYGHAGPAFMDKLLPLLAREPLVDYLRVRYTEFVGTISGGSTNGVRLRKAGYTAVLALGEELACAWGILPYAPLPIEAWAGTADAPRMLDDTDDRALEASEILTDWVVKNPGRLWKGADDAGNLFTESGLPGAVDIGANSSWAGRWVKVDGVLLPALFPGDIKLILEQAGLTFDAVRPKMIADGHIMKAKDGRAQQLHRCCGSRKDSTMRRVYVLRHGQDG